jgi:hypothetical protein
MTSPSSPQFLRTGASPAPDLQAAIRDRQSAALKSFVLLREWLSLEQLAQMETKGHFEVIGSKTGKRYRIYSGTLQNVYELDKKGRPVRGWCFAPEGYLPAGDVMLAQKIALETDEADTMKVALPFWVERGPGRFVRWVALRWDGI